MNSAEASAFVREIEKRPKDFEQGRYSLRDKVSGLQWWTGNGVAAFGLYENYSVGTNITFASVFVPFLLPRWRAWRAYKKWRSARVVERMSPAKEDVKP